MNRATQCPICLLWVLEREAASHPFRCEVYCLAKAQGYEREARLWNARLDRARAALPVHCGWGAEHEAHAHPGLDNRRCPGGPDPALVGS